MAIVTSARAQQAVVPARGGGGAAAHHYEEGGRTVVCVQGEIDLGTLTTLEAALERAAAESDAGIVVDVAQVRFMDASGLERIMALRDELAPRGRAVVVRNPRGVVQRLFSVLEAGELIED